MLTMTFDEFYNKIKTLLENGHNVLYCTYADANHLNQIGLFNDEIVLCGNYYEKNEVNKITIDESNMITIEFECASKIYYHHYYVYSTINFK